MIVFAEPAWAVPVSVVTDDAVTVMFPVIADGVIVNVGLCVSYVKANCGVLVISKLLIAHEESEAPLTIFWGTMS